MSSTRPLEVDEQVYTEFIELISFWREIFEVDDFYYLKIVEGLRSSELNRKAVVKYVLRFVDLMKGSRRLWDIDPAEVLVALKDCEGCVEKLKWFTLLSVDLDVHGGCVKEIFGALRGVRHVGPTTASKILHAIHPGLFVMCDEPIRKGFGVGGSGRGYLEFLRRMQSFARGIVEFHARKCGLSFGEAEKDLCSGGKSIAKLIDEYNWLKFTFGAERVRRFRELLQ